MTAEAVQRAPRSIVERNVAAIDPTSDYVTLSCKNVAACSDPFDAERGMLDCLTPHAKAVTFSNQ
jgi:hypothetical protein